MKTTTLIFASILLCLSSISAQSYIQLGQDIVGEAVEDELDYSAALSSDSHYRLINLTSLES